MRSALSRYAAEGLFVVSCDHSGVIALSAVLPIALHFDGDEKTPDEMLLSLTEPSVQPLDTYRIVKTSVAALNCVLGVLIPGMSLEIREYGGQMTRTARMVCALKSFLCERRTGFLLNMNRRGSRS